MRSLLRITGLGVLLFATWALALRHQAVAEPFSEFSGRVLDASTHRPISGVEVQMTGTALASNGLPTCAGLAVTDSAGSYCMGACGFATVSLNVTEF
jgi:hypothetical protein